MKQAALVVIVGLSALTAVVLMAQETERPAMPPIPSLETAKADSEYETVQNLIDQTLAFVEAVEALQPSKLEQWQARDDLIQLVFDLDEETAYYLYNVVQAALERREESAKELAAIYAAIEANETRRALSH